MVTGASKGIGLADRPALADEGARVVAGARSADGARGPRRRDRGGGRPRRAGRAGALVQRAIDEHGRVDVLVNNVGARAHAARRLPRHQRRGVRVGDADELLHRPARDPRGAPADGRAGRRRDRQRRLGQRVLPARRRHDRLRRRQGRAAEPQQVAGAGVRGARASTSTASRPGRSRTELWLGEHGVAATVAAATGIDADTARERSSPASAASPPAASPRPRRSPRSSSSSPPSAPPTSPAPTTSSTAA